MCLTSFHRDWDVAFIALSSIDLRLSFLLRAFTDFRSLSSVQVHLILSWIERFHSQWRNRVKLQVITIVAIHTKNINRHKALPQKAIRAIPLLRVILLPSKSTISNTRHHNRVNLNPNTPSNHPLTETLSIHLNTAIKTSKTHSRFRSPNGMIFGPVFL